MKKFLITTVAAIALVASTVTAYAGLNQFYNESIGQWTVEGYYGDKNFCSAKTYWDNGSYLSVFVLRDSEEISIYLHNNDWNIADASGTNPAYIATIHFTGKYSPDSGTINYELVDNQTIILRNVNDKFINSWTSYDTMEIVMPGNIGRMIVGLDGTKALVPVFVDCIEKLKATGI